MKRFWYGMILVGILITMLTVPTLAQGPEVAVSDQTMKGNTVTIEKVVYDQQGWIVIHKDADGKPGPVIGWAAIQPGENTNVVVTLQESLSGPTKLWAMLHTDAGTAGEYEFPGSDTPVKMGDAIVMTPFTATPAPAMLPTTGGTALPILPFALLVVGVLLILGVLTLRIRPQMR